MLRRLIAPLAVGAALFAAPAAQAVETVATERQPFTASGYKSVIAWSSFDPSAQAYRLKLRVGTQIVTPSIPPRAGDAFDVNVGPLPNGRGYGVVYSRCRTVTDNDGGRGCDIYLYDVQTGGESRLPSSSGIRDETHPALHGSFVAFARTYQARGGSGTRDVVYKARTDGEGGSKRMPTPASRRAGVAFLDIGTSGRVAYVWNTPSGEFASSTLYRVRTGDRRLQRVYRARSGGLNAARTLSPTVSGLNVYWARTNSGSGTGNRIFRFNPGSGNYYEARGSSRWTSVSYRGTQGFVTTSAIAGETCVGNIQDENDLSKSECRLETLSNGELTFRRATSPLGLR